MVKRYSIETHGEWGDVYGLPSADLSLEQLKKLRFSKLVELSIADPRAEKLVGDMLLTQPLDTVVNISHLSEPEIISLPYLMKQYNEFVKRRGPEIVEYKRNHWGGASSSLLRWNLFDDYNKQKDIENFINRAHFSVEINNLDYKWLYNTNSYLAKSLTSHIIEKHSEHTVCNMLSKIDHKEIYSKYPEIGGQIIQYAFKNGGNPLQNVVEQMPQEVFLAILPKMFEQPEKIYMYALSQSCVPKNYAIKALKAISKKRYLPSIKREIDFGMLKAIPPITRLGTIESIMNSVYEGRITMPFKNVTEDEMRNLLFTSTIKYHQRVEFIISTFNKNLKKVITQ